MGYPKRKELGKHPRCRRGYMKLKVIHRYRVDDEDCEGDCKSVVIKNKNKIIAEYGDYYCDPCDKADRFSTMR